jgi:hypothetical protein
MEATLTDGAMREDLREIKTMLKVMADKGK